MLCCSAARIPPPAPHPALPPNRFHKHPTIQPRSPPRISYGKPPRWRGCIRGGPGAQARPTRLHGGTGVAARGWRDVPGPGHGAGAGDRAMAAPAPSPIPGGGMASSPGDGGARCLTLRRGLLYHDLALSRVHGNQGECNTLNLGV
jgi:hypothetical protein